MQFLFIIHHRFYLHLTNISSFIKKLRHLKPSHSISLIHHLTTNFLIYLSFPSIHPFTFSIYIHSLIHPSIYSSLIIFTGHSKVLQSAALPILPDSTCKADYVYGPTRLTEGMYCAGYMEGGIDTCQGDSGGPMVCIVDGMYHQIGD